MTTILYCALLLEAYMNHVGNRKFSKERWEGTEEKKGVVWYSPKDKLKEIAEAIGYNLDLNSEPFKSFPLIFKFRRQLVHGKTITISFENEQVIEKGRAPALPKTAWEKMLETPTTAEKFFTHTETMMQKLHTAAGLDSEHDLFSYSSRHEWESWLEDFSARE